MEIWKVIVLLITVIYSIICYKKEKYSITSSESFFLIVFIMLSVAIICEQINWDFLFKKI